MSVKLDGVADDVTGGKIPILGAHLGSMLVQVTCWMRFAGRAGKRLAIVVFIGGVTFAEMAALRYLGRQPAVDTDFLIATTKIVSGNSLLVSCMDPAVAASLSTIQNA